MKWPLPTDSASELPRAKHRAVRHDVELHSHERRVLGKPAVRDPNRLAEDLRYSVAADAFANLMHAADELRDRIDHRLRANAM
jgi:hypothetical protein